MKNKVGTAIIISALGAMGTAASAYGQEAIVAPPQVGQATPAGQALEQVQGPQRILAPVQQLRGDQQAVQGGWVVTPYISVTETFTDDVDIDETFAQSDFVTTTTLGVQALTDGPRFDLNLNYALSHIFYPGLEGDNDEFRHYLLANSQSEIVEDLFYFDAAASVQEQFIDRRGAFTSVELARSVSRATVSIIDVQPYFLNRIDGNFATLRTGYGYSLVDTSGATTFTGIETGANRNQFHEFNALLSSGTRFTRFTWDWETFYQSLKRSTNEDLETIQSTFTGEYQINRYVAAIGMIGYNKRQSADPLDYFNGEIWRVGGRLTPGPRTSLQVTYGKDFFADTWNAFASYTITPNLELTASYNDQYQTFAENALQFFQDGNGNNADINQNFILGDFTRIKEYRVALIGTRGRSIITVSAVRRSSETDNPLLDYDRDAIGIIWTRQMNTKLSLTLGGNVMKDDFQDARQSDIFMNFEARLDYAVSANIVASLEYIHTEREQERFDYVSRGSNYISATIGYVF